MSNFIRIIEGRYRDMEINDKVFPVIKGVKTGAKGEFVTVDGSEHVGADATKIRVRVTKYEMVGDETGSSTAHVEQEESEETDEEIISRIQDRFEILEEMSSAAIDGVVRSLMVCGPPGVGKSYGIHKQIREAEMLNDMADRGSTFKVIKGMSSPLSLYMELFNHSSPGSVLVFDDCDNILYDETSLNLLKAALDSSDERWIMWNTNSRLLGDEGIPNSFKFEGSVIFISNIYLDRLRASKIKSHIEAIMSRSHVIDVGLTTIRDKVLRIKQIARTGKLFANYKFNEAEQAEIIDYMVDNVDRLREISLRMAVKLADLKRINGKRWQRIANVTCMK